MSGGRRGVLAEDVHGGGPVRGQVVVLQERLVQRLGGFDGQRRAGGQGGALEAAAHADQQGLVFGQGEGPAFEFHHGEFGDDVGDVAGLGNVHGDAVVARDLLAQQAHGHLAQHGGVGGVDAQVRCGGGVGCLAGERGPVAAHGLGAGAGGVVGDAVLDRVDHQGQPHAVERAGLQHEGLAAAVLLRGGADGLERDAQRCPPAGPAPAPRPRRRRRSGCARRRGRSWAGRRTRRTGQRSVRRCPRWP